MAPFVGLTGGLGAGKSEALRLLGELGAATLSTDTVVHELLSSADVQDSIARRFGADVASDRAKIA
jgi:dephospho-CoA kinase